MTPDAKDLCVFAVKRGDMKNRLDINYNLPQYTMLEEKLYQTFGENLKRISDIADVICGPFGSAIKNTDYQDSGIPLVRITNINKDGYMNYDDLIYISEKLGDSLSKTQVSNGDIVVSQRGSLGQCAIVDDSFPKMNISANIIAIKNINGVSVSFLHDYFLSTVGQTLLERSVSGQVQSKITTQDIADLLIPVNTDETKLTDLLDSAYKSYKRKLQQADKLQRKNPTYLIERLGLTSDYSETQKLTYATTAGSIEGRIDADYYSPKFSHFRSQIEALPYHTVSVDDICDDNSVYQFTRKVKALPGGALFKYDNGCSVFLSYNFFSILKESNITQSRLSLDMFRAVTEKFFIEYHQDLSAIPPLANTLVQFCCHSLSNQNPEHYVCCQKAKVSSNKLVVDFEVNSSKIASDIAEAIDRSVEYSVIGELLQPLVCLSKDSYSELFEKMELTSGQKKTLGTTAVRIDYYFNPDTYEIKETDVSELSIRKQIAKICAAAGVLPGTYERRDATEIVRKIQESVVSHLEQAIRTLERDRLHILLLSALATEQLSVNLNRTGATLTEDIEEGERIKSLEKSTQLSEKAKMRKSALLYLIETNLYLVNERKEEAIDSSKLSELLSFAKWIIYLQNSSDLCFHTDSDTKLIVEDDYRIDVELGENYSQTFEKESQRRIIAEPFNLRGDNTDRDFFEKVANAFYEDLGVHFKVLESVLHHLSDSSFSHDNVEFDEIAPNVIKAKATDVLNDYLSFVVENVPVEDVKSAYDFLTIVPGQLKTICDTTHPILPIWEREKRNHCFAVRPIYMSNNDYIYSPIIMEEVRKRWIEGFLQFYPPFEIGLERTCTALYAWKNNYEHLFSSEVEVLLKESGCEYAKHDVDLRREDRRGNHPTIDVLGDYDVIGLNTTQKRIFIIECKVLQPIGSVFEHSNQQKRFFTKEKFDEKFQKRIDYFSKVAMSFFANHGYDTEGFTINPYMVVNKVFSSYYKHVQFPIVTFDELKREIQL